MQRQKQIGMVLGILALLFAQAQRPAAAQDAAEKGRGDKAKASGQQSIHWEHDLNKAWARSARDGRPVLAYFTFET